MVLLLDWNERAAFGRVEIVESVRHVFLNKGGVDFKWFLEGEKSDDGIVNFSINPRINAFSFPETVTLNKCVNSVFSLAVNPDKMDKNWKGELLMKSGGFVRRIDLEFEKKKL